MNFVKGNYSFANIIIRTSDAFTFAFEFAFLWSRFTRKYNCLFRLHLFTFHFLRLKQKMDSLLFLIKKNNHKTAGYDKLACIVLLTKSNKIAYTTCCIIYELLNYRKFSKH